MKRVTIVDVAEVAGVSIATVSYVINDGPKTVSEDTRKRVLAAIKSTGYQPHTIARSLRTGTTQTIGLLVPSYIPSFISSLVNSLEDALYERNYGLIIATSHEDKNRELNMINTLINRSIDGLLFIPSRVNDGQLLQNLQKRGLKVVFVDRYMKNVDADIVMTNNVEAARYSTEYLINKGCREILCMSFSSEASSALDRVEGYKKALRENNLPIKPERIHLFEYAAGERLEDALKDHFKECGIPDGIFCTSDNILIDALYSLKTLGIKVPDQVRVTGGFHYSPWSTLIDPPVPLVNQDHKLITEFAVDFLLDRINGDDSPARVKMVDPIYSMFD